MSPADPCAVCGRAVPSGTARYCRGCGATLHASGDAGACDVILSFDLDGPSGAINRDPLTATRPSSFSLGEYGPNVGAPHVLQLLHDQGVLASFYIPGWVAERHPRLVERIAAAGHEVGHHGYLHEPPATLSREAEAEVLDRGSAILAEITGAPPAGYRSPSWELSEHSIDLLRERAFRYDSSLMGSDAPYWAAPALVEIPIHWALDDYPYFIFTATDGRRLMASPSHVFEAWRDAFDEVHHRGGLFTLTMHPYIIGRPGRLPMLRRLIAHMHARPNVRFRRAVDVAEEFAAAEEGEGGP